MMLLGGVSVQGNYHDENQDSFRSVMLDHGFAVALSDGLGSRRDSKAGSQAVCESVVEIAGELGAELTMIDPRKFARLVHDRWLEKLSGREISQCYATMLCFVLYEGHAFAARLGDGFVGFWLDGSLEVLFDAKENHYDNETDCLTEEFTVDCISVFEKDVMEVRGGVMSSDGLEFEEMTRDELLRFVKAFVEGYRGMRREDVIAHMENWLRDWPGSDDKTLAFFIAEEERADEKSI